MQTGDTRLFLYDNTVELVITTNSLSVSNLPMNHRKLQAHKGLTNTIMFNIRNRDRTLQNVFTDVLTAYFIDPTTKKRLTTKILEHTSDVGIAKLVLETGDIQNIDPGLYRMYIARTSVSGDESPIYSNQNNGVSFDIEISEEAQYEPIATQEDSTFTSVGANVNASSAMFGNLDRNFINAQHTLGIYTSTYTGNIIIQGSCIESTPDSDEASTDWFAIETIPLANTSAITNRTFQMNLNWIRILEYPDDGNSVVSNFMVRN
jgi:hypothetical protein